ncbi:MAG TPA: 8-oxoguanine deaminase [Pseudomonadales bacterium]|nr:8-oxoguanine deaminase [Pseudomonadales bacterium]
MTAVESGADQAAGGARLWIRDPLATFTATDEAAPRGVVVADGRIVELVGAEGPRTPVAHTFDAGARVLMPGLVNCHHHFYQTLTRSHPDAIDKALFPWLEALYPVWRHLQPEDVGVATEMALAELLLSGCTTAADHHYLFPDACPDAVDLQVAAAQRLGARVLLTRGSMSLGQSAGGLPPDSVVQTEDAILADSERVIGRYHDRGADARVRIALAPCSPFSVTKGLMAASAELARAHGVLLHTHLAETEDENAFCLASFGQRPLDYLAEVGWLADDVWLAHGIHFEDGEIARLGAAGVGICHCPSSNMLLGSGTCPVGQLEAAGCGVGLGVDGSASNDASNMIQEARQAMLLQKLANGSAAVTARDALRWATAGGARTLHWPEVGRLAVGANADLALFDLEALRFSGVGEPLAGLLNSGAVAARDVMVGGHWRVRDGALVDVDVAELRARHEASARRLRAAVA